MEGTWIEFGETPGLRGGQQVQKSRGTLRFLAHNLMDDDAFL